MYRKTEIGNKLIKDKAEDIIDDVQDIRLMAEYLELKEEVLKEALRNLYDMFKYAEEISSILHTYISDADYEEAVKEIESNASKWSRSYKVGLKDEEIATAAKIVLDALDKELGTDDIADILNTDVLETEMALQKYRRDNENEPA